MDMKKILQAMDGISTKPVEGADSMAKFLRVVKEAEINQVPAMPDIAGLQAGQSKDLGNGSNVTVNADGTVSYQGGWGTYIYNAQGQHVKTQSPSMAGYSQETDPTGNVTQQNYSQGPMNIQKGPEGTTANYQLGADNLQTTVQENSLNKFLSIVDKNNVSILSEGANPHKVALPVQMTMQHYQQAESSTTSSTEPSLLKKYFHEVESEVNEQAQAKRQVINQYASVIAERVMKKQSKKKIVNEGNLEVLRPTDGSAPDDYDKIQFRIDGEPVEPGSEEFDYYYQLVFKKDPPEKSDPFVDTLKGMMSKDHSSMGADPHKDSENDVQDSDVIIPSHPKGHWVRVPDISEMAAHLRNDPDGHTIIPHGGMGSGKEETWKSVSTKKLQQVIDMINSGNYSGAEHVLYKNGFLQGAVQALARYEEFKTKQGNRRMKAGREVELGEQDMVQPGHAVDPQLKSKFEELLLKF